MPSFSILTNAEATSALFNLNRTQNLLATTQDRISSGLKIGSAKDDASIYSVSIGMRNDVAGFKAIQETLSLGSGTVDVALNAVQRVEELLTQMKTKVVQAQSDNVDRAAIQKDIDGYVEQIDSIVQSAQFNGVNLVGDVAKAAAEQSLSVLAGLDRASAGATPTPNFFDVEHVNLTSTELGNSASTQSISTIDVETEAGQTAANQAIIYHFAGGSNQSFTTGDVFTVVVADPRDSTVGYQFTLTGVAGTAVDANQFDISGGDEESAAEQITATLNGGSTVGVRVTLDSTGAVVSGSEDATETVTFSETGLAATALTANTMANGNVTGALRIADGDGETSGYQLISASYADITGATVSGAAINVAYAADPDDAAASFDQVDITVNATAAATDGVLTLYNTAGDRVEVEVDNLGTAADDIVTSLSDAIKTATGASTLAEIGLSVEALDLDSDGTNETVRIERLAVSDAYSIGRFHVGEDFVGSPGSVFDPRDTFLATATAAELDDNPTGTGLQDSDLDEMENLSFTYTRSQAASISFEIDKVEAAISTIQSVSATLGTFASRLEVQSDFMDSLVGSIEEGIGTLVDANMAEESALLQALQVQQQLGIQALSIANQSPQSILGLFR